MFFFFLTINLGGGVDGIQTHALTDVVCEHSGKKKTNCFFFIQFHFLKIRTRKGTFSFSYMDICELKS